MSSVDEKSRPDVDAFFVIAASPSLVRRTRFTCPAAARSRGARAVGGRPLGGVVSWRNARNFTNPYTSTPTTRRARRGRQHRPEASAHERLARPPLRWQVRPAPRVRRRFRRLAPPPPLTPSSILQEVGFPRRPPRHRFLVDARATPSPPCSARSATPRRPHTYLECFNADPPRVRKPGRAPAFADPAREASSAASARIPSKVGSWWAIAAAAAAASAAAAATAAAILGTADLKQRVFVFRERSPSDDVDADARGDAGGACAGPRRVARRWRTSAEIHPHTAGRLIACRRCRILAPIRRARRTCARRVRKPSGGDRHAGQGDRAARSARST